MASFWELWFIEKTAYPSPPLFLSLCHLYYFGGDKVFLCSSGWSTAFTLALSYQDYVSITVPSYAVFVSSGQVVPGAM